MNNWTRCCSVWATDFSVVWKQTLVSQKDTLSWIILQCFPFSGGSLSRDHSNEYPLSKYYQYRSQLKENKAKNSCNLYIQPRFRGKIIKKRGEKKTWIENTLGYWSLHRMSHSGKSVKGQAHSLCPSTLFSAEAQFKCMHLFFIS